MLKNTKTRTRVREILDTSNTPLTPAQIFDKLKDENITLSSIYRTLETFSKENIVIKANDQKGTALYTLSKDGHCHYLECKKCHKKIRLNYCPYHTINKKIAKDYGFNVDESNVVMYGLCQNCHNNHHTESH